MHAHAWVVGGALYLVLLVGGAAGLTGLEDWHGANSGDFLAQLQAILAAACVLFIAAWQATRTRFGRAGRRRPD